MGSRSYEVRSWGLKGETEEKLEVRRELESRNLELPYSTLISWFKFNSSYFALPSYQLVHEKEEVRTGKFKVLVNEN